MEQMTLSDYGLPTKNFIKVNYYQVDDEQITLFEVKK